MARSAVRNAFLNTLTMETPFPRIPPEMTTGPPPPLNPPWEQWRLEGLVISRVPKMKSEGKDSEGASRLPFLSKCHPE